SSTGCNITATTTLNVSDAAGTCSVTATKAADNNYNSATSAAITVTLTPKNITVTAQAATKVFGDTDPTFLYTSSDLSATFTGTLSRDPGESAGVYAMTIGSLAIVGNNYSISSFVSANLTITQAPPTITNVSPTSTLLSTTPTLTITGTGFATGTAVTFNGSSKTPTINSVNELTITLNSSNTATAGTKTIVVTNGGGSATSTDFSVLNPTPVTTSISPTSTIVATGGFTLTVNGTDFITSSEVYWNGASRTTTYVSPTKLTAVITSGDVASVGSASVTVVSPTPGGGASNAQTFTIESGVVVPTKFVILNPTDGTTDSPIVVTIEAQNNSGDVATTYGHGVTLLKDGSATGGGLVNIQNGVGTTTISDTVAETVNLSLSDTASTGLNTSSTQDVVFTAGATKYLSLNDQVSMTAGTRLPYLVTRKDQYNNLKTVGSEIFYLSSDSAGTKRFYDAATNGNVVTTVTIQNGTSTGAFWYHDEFAGNSTVTVSDTSPADGATGVVDAVDAVTVTAAAPSQLYLNDEITTTAGARVAYTITRKDAFNNLSTSGDTTVYLFSDSAGTKRFYDAATNGNIITYVTIGNGVSSANAWYYDEHAGTTTVTASDSTPANGGAGIADATDSIIVTPGATGKFILDNPGDMTVGTFIMYTISRQDAFGNTVTTGSDTVYLSSNSTGFPGGTTAFYNSDVGGAVITYVTIADGSSSATAWYFDEQAGLWTITASDSSPANGVTGIIDGTDSITVSTAPIIASQFTIVNPTDGVVGDTIAVLIRAENNSGSLDTSYSGSVTLNTSGQATPQNGVVVTITGGRGSTNITDTKAETVSLTLTDSAATGFGLSTQDVIFSPGATKQYFLNSPSDITAGTRAGYTVTRKDVYGNLVTSGSETVYLYSNATGGLSEFYDAASGGTLSPSIGIANGSSVASFWYYEGKAGSWGVTASDATPTADNATGIIDATDAIVVTPAATSQYILNDPGDITAGTRVGYTVSREDQFGNLVTSGSESVYLYASPVSTSSAFYSSASGGSPISVRTINSGASSAGFWYYDEVAGIVTITVSDSTPTANGGAGIADASDSVTISSIPIVATRFTILNPSDVMVGGSTVVTVRAEDNNGNVQTTYNRNVTLNVSGSATGGGVVTIQNGVGTKTITDAVAETVTLTLTDSAVTGLDTSSVQDVLFSAQPIITAGGSQVVSAPVRSTVVFSGTAFAGAKLTIVGTGNGDIPVRQGTIARADGSFTLRFSDITPGIKSYFLSVIDKDGRLTQTKVYNVNVNQQLIVRDVFLPPTIGFTQRAVIKGGFLGIKGFAIPGATISASVDGNEITETAKAGSTGEYTLLFNTFNLPFGAHPVRAYQTRTSGETSDSSTERTFIVTNLLVPQTDLNGDGIINASDLSIFLAKWLSTDPTTKGSLDFNGDGKVDIQDLSIFAQNIGK
ncbi:MAG: MBG domain-containing protein, partial [bacterium]